MLTLSADGRQLWTGHRSGSSVVVIDTTSGQVIKSIAVESAPHGHLKFMAGIRAIIVAGAAGQKDACRAAVWNFEPLRVAAGLPDVRRPTSAGASTT